MLGETGEHGIRTAPRQNLGIARGDHATALALQRPGDDRRTAAPGSAADELVDELDELIREPDRDLLAHPVMVPKRYQDRRFGSATPGRP